jgi:hypothetical protein
MRFFANVALQLDALKKALAAEDPSFKIDGGELSRGGQLLAEIEINKPPSDMFDDDIQSTVQKLQRVGAHQVIPHIQATQATLSVMMIDPNAMELLGPFWNVLSRMADGLWEMEGQGFYHQGNLVVAC